MHFASPVYDSYFADPFVWRYEGTYYAVGTGPASSKSDGPTRFPLLRSRDLIHWEPLGHALIAVDPGLGDAYWAPEVAYSDGLFHLYYSVGHGDKGHHLRLALSDRPQGPYEDVGEPVNDPSGCPFAIDPHPFRDDDGGWYLFYARDFLGRDGGFRAGTGIVVDRLVNMRKLAGEEVVVARARSDWQRFRADRPMYGGIYDWHTLEGPCVIKDSGRYYCLYSGGCWKNASYGVDFAESNHVLGPYSDIGSEAGPRVLRTRPGELIGPGHCSIVESPDGAGECLVYHAWDPAMTARRMCVDRLLRTPAGPRVLHS